MAMNMKMCLIKFILFLQITKKINSYDLVCPSTSQWNLRASAICLEKNSYACLLNRTHEKYNENCQGPDDVESGRKLVFQSLGFISEKCTFERYQPIAFSSFGNSDCVFRKSTCSEEGQVVCSDNSLDVDVSCRCDHTKGYKFVSKTRNPCYCIPSNEDCSCFRSDNITEVVNSSCGNSQDVCIGTITTISGIRTNFSYGEHHNINIISDFKRHNNLLSHAIILILIGIVTVTIAYTMFATHLDGYYIDQFKKEIHPDKTNIHTKDEIEEHKFRDDGLKAKLITGPKLHKNKPGIKHLPMQDNANPIEESEHNKYQYQLFNNDFATGNCTDQINNEMNSDKTNMHTQHAMEETKYRVEGHKGKLITGLTLDKGQPDIDHQSKQTESETKHIEKCDQMTEEDFATGFQLDEDQPDIEHLSNQAKAETNHIEEREQNNYQFQLIEDVATGYYNDKFKYKVHSDNINIHTQEAMEEKNDRDEGQKVKLITGLELDEDKPGIEHQSMQDQAGTKHIEERNQMTENDVATGLGLDGDKPGIEYQPSQDQADTKDIEERDQMAENDFVTGPVLIEENLASNHQSCQCRDDELHIEESDDNKCQSREEYSTACRETNEDKLASNHQLCQGRDEEFHIEKGDDNQCQYKMSGEVHVTASSECTDQNKFISNADKPNPHPQDEIVQNRDRDGGPNADIITASSECTDQNKFISSADKPNSHPQDEIAQNRTRDGGPNADIITGPFQDNGCSNYEDKTECDADKTKLETKNVGADRKTLHEQSEPNLIPARHEQNNKSNPDIDNRLQVIIEEHSMKRKTSNDDISIREMAEAQCVVKDLSNTGNENNEVVRKENRRTETGTDCKDIKEKTEKHIVTTSKQDKDVKSKEIADKQYKFDVLVKSLDAKSGRVYFWQS
ncbi:uncharacterized protein LOC143074071 [Mytilus galloprovincialis]|uniref:uncharacterized protein LOC143074071 n=1 Tax=Mytilus galloprovincialis TaxID=29158 RepID=UPI003F7C4532